MALIWNIYNLDQVFENSTTICPRDYVSGMVDNTLSFDYVKRHQILY